MMKSTSPNLRISLPAGLQAIKEYEQLKFCGTVPKKACFRYEFHALPDEIRIPELNCRIGIRVFQWNEKRSARAEHACAFMDMDTLRFPLIVRSWEAGDRFQPLGMVGQKKIKDFLIDLKLPRGERDRIPLVVFGDRVAWVGGQRIDDRVKVTGFTKNVLEMELQQ
jgi:tRNA(Ile)-lysidine synthase